MLSNSGSKSRCYSGVQCGIVHTAHDVNVTSFLHRCLFGSVLVCFGLPVESLKYEDTTGRPRNDEDSVGGSGVIGLQVWVCNVLGSSDSLGSLPRSCY